MNLRLAIGFAWTICLPLAAQPAQAQSTPGDGLIRHFPANTLLLVSGNGKLLKEQLPQTALGKLLAEPRVASLLKAFDQVLRDLQEIGGPGDPLQTLVRLDTRLQEYSYAVGLLGIDWPESATPDAPTPGGPPGLRALAILDGPADDPANGPELLAELRELLENLGLPPGEPVTFGTHTLLRQSLPGFPVPLLHGQVGNLLVFALGEEAVKHLIHPPATSLAQAPDYLRGRTRVVRDAEPPVGEVHLNVAGLRREILQAVGRRAPAQALTQVEAVLAASGLDRVQTVTAASACVDQGFRSTLWVQVTPNGKPLPAPLSPEALASVPRDTRLVSAGRWDPTGCWQWVLDVLNAAAPEQRTRVDAGLAQLEEVLGFQLAEFLAALGTEFVVHLDPDMPGPFPSPVLQLKPAAPEALQSHLQKLVEFIGQLAAAQGGATIALRQTELAGATVHSLSIRGAPVPVTPAWALVEGRLLCALHVAHLEDVLLRRQQPGAGSLQEAPDFVRARALLPNTVHALSYVDTAALAGWLYGLALPLVEAGLQSGVLPVDLDPSLFPAPYLVTRHLFGEASACVREPDGFLWLTHAPSTMPMSALLAIGGTSFLAGLTVPVVTRARGSAQEVRDAHDAHRMHMVGQILQIYASEHGDRLPDSLEALHAWSPEMAGDIELWNARLIYVGGGLRVFTASPQSILVHARHPNPNGTWKVYTLGGQLEDLSESQLQERLATQRERP